MYKRILLKLSGEQLQGDHDGGHDVERMAWIAREVKQVIDRDIQVVIMVGGGNLARGSQLAGKGIRPITAHYTGMLATMMNAITLADVFNSQGVKTRALTTVKADQVADLFTHRQAEGHLEKGRVVIIGGGLARPYLTTDTAALGFALEMNCDVVIKTTKVDGVYDRDPAKHKDAKKFDKLSYQEALANSEIQVMDKAAIGLAMEEQKPVIICDLLTDQNIARAASGEAVGTLIS